MSANVTVDFVVPVGYEPGDYAQLHSNGGDGDINWSSPVDETVYNLFPNGAGIYSWGHAPWGHFRWGHCHSMRTVGWGYLPWGNFPWGHGTAVVTALHEVTACGDYKFGFACYDQLGNLHSGDPEEAEVEIHVGPPAPTGLKKNSYNKTTDILVLDVV